MTNTETATVHVKAATTVVHYPLPADREPVEYVRTLAERHFRGTCAPPRSAPA